MLRRVKSTVKGVKRVADNRTTLYGALDGIFEVISSISALINNIVTIKDVFRDNVQSDLFTSVAIEKETGES